MLLTLFWLIPAPANAQAAPQPTGITVGGDNLTRLLWNNPDGTTSVWKLTADGLDVSLSIYGPYPGWTALSLASGADSAPRILWNHPSDGQISLWRVDPFSAAFTFANYGPYPGWSVFSLGVGGNNAPRVLWNHAPDNLMSLWNVAPDTTLTQGTYGPYTGYTAFRVAAGPNSIPRTLWNKSDGSISLWYSTADASNYAHTEYGPFAGYAPAALAVDSTNAPRILWNHPSDRTVSLWTVAGDGTYTYKNYSDPSGYSPVAMAAGTGGDLRLLWSNGQGDAQIWVISANGGYSVKTYSNADSTTLQLLSVATNPNTVTSGGTSVCIVTLSSAAPAGGATISLSSSNSGVASVPPSVSVPNGATRATFNIATSLFTSSPATTVTIYAAYAGVSRNTALTVNPDTANVGGSSVPTGADPDYKIFANPVNADVTERVSGSVNTMVTINVLPVNSFNGNVSLYLPTLPNGVTASLSSPVVSTASGNASSDLIFTVASTTRPGDYTINLQSISSYDNKSRYTPVSLTVEPAVQNTNFTITEDVDGLELEAGSSDKAALTLSPGAGFNSPVSLSLESDPRLPVSATAAAKITGVFSAPTLTSANSTSILTIQVGSQVPKGNYNMLIRGSAYTGTQTLVLTVFVVANTDNAVYDQNVPAPAYPDPGPSESGTSDMLRYDLNSSPSGQASAAQPQAISGPYVSGPYVSGPYDLEASFAGLRPRFLGNSDDRIYIKPTYYPFSAICRIAAYFGSSPFPHIGTGVLIGKNHVLTTAHLFYNGPTNFATKIVVSPGYDHGVSSTYHHASVKWAWVPTYYESALRNGGNYRRSDWAILDVNPTTDVPKAKKGKGLGTYASYMHAVNDFVSPAYAYAAGYPGNVTVNGMYLDEKAEYMFYSFTGNGDDGYVTDVPPGQSGHSVDSVFYTIDISEGDSGGPIYHTDPARIDPLYHVFAVINGSNDTGTTGYNFGTRINHARQVIIGSLLQEDKDEN